MQDNNGERHICCQCGRSLPLSSYFKSCSRFYAGIGHIPICKTCLTNDYKAYKSEYVGSTERAMQRICMLADIYYDPAIFDSCDMSEDKVVGTYIRQTNLGQYKGKTLDDSPNSCFSFMDTYAERNAKKAAKEVKAQTNSGTEEHINPKLKMKWGAGLSRIDYEELEKHYNYLKSANPHTDSNQDIFITELCYTKMQQMKAIREGDVDAYKKLSDTYRSAFQQAKLNTDKSTNINNDFTIGVNAEAIEKFTPAEYYKNQKLFKDSDNVGEYYQRMILRPIRNLMFGENERDYEYYVKEEDDADGFSEE